MRSAIMDDVLIADRSDIVVELMVLKSNIPGFFVSNIIGIRYFESLVSKKLQDFCC